MIADEKQRKTMHYLMASRLSSGEIVLDKLVARLLHVGVFIQLVGAVWGLRGFGGLISLFWLLGLAAGAVHPLGLLLSLLVVGLLTWFVTALGTYASLMARTTSRALTITIATLLFLNVGYLGVLYPMIMVFSDPSEWRYPGVGVTPVLASGSLLSYRQVATIVGTEEDRGQLAGLDYRGVLYGVMVLIGYAIAAAMLIRWSIRRFAALVDRPRRE